MQFYAVLCCFMLFYAGLCRAGIFKSIVVGVQGATVMADDSQEHAEVEDLMRASPDVVLARAESFRDSEDVEQGPGHVGNASDVPVE
jgi:capsular polysaccharide biosynthesis protein